MSALLSRVHPGLILAALAIFGFAVASYLAAVALAGTVPYCGPVRGCVEVATSEYAWIGPIPVAVFGVSYSTLLLGAAIAWWRTGDRRILAGHYGLSLAGLVFEVYLLYLQVFVIEAICIWCVLYGISTFLGFLLKVAWLRRETVPAGAGW